VIFLKKKYLQTKIIPSTNTQSKVDNLIRACKREEAEIERLREKFRVNGGKRK
jgi:hypothetical protein